MTDEPEDLAGDVVRRLADYLGGEHAQTGLISQRLVAPALGRAEATTSVELMRKVALAFADGTHIVVDPAAKGGKRSANTFERLARAGVTPEMYSQMVQSPEFPRLLNRTAIEFVVLPQLPAIQAALTAKAAHGDDRAARVLFELSRLTELPTIDDMRREYATLDETGWKKRIRDELEASLALLDEMEGNTKMDES